MSFKTRASEMVGLMPLKNLSLWIIAINLLSVFVILLMQNSLPPVIPLFYGKPYGAEQLTASINLTIPPLAAIGVSAVNILVGSFIDDEFLKKVIFGSMVVITILSLVTVIKIIFLVGGINVI